MDISCSRRVSLLGNIRKLGNVCLETRTAVRAVCGFKTSITETVWGCRFSDLNLPPKNWTFPCTVATLGEIKVSLLPLFCIMLVQIQILALEKQAAMLAEGVMIVSSYLRAIQSVKLSQLCRNGCMPSPSHAVYYLILWPKVRLKMVLYCRAMHPTLHKTTPWPTTPTWPSPARRSTPFTQPASPTPAMSTSPMTRPSAGAYRSYADSSPSESPLWWPPVPSLALHLQETPKIPAILVSFISYTTQQALMLLYCCTRFVIRHNQDKTFIVHRPGFLLTREQSE